MSRALDTHTHIIPYMTTTDAQGYDRAACGVAPTSVLQLAAPGARPTCWGCAMWNDNLDVIEPATPETGTAA